MTKLSTEKLGEIPETMLITLWAKSEESKFKEPFLIDKRAEEIIWKIDYDFTKFKKSKFSQAGICLRASLIDREVREFIEKNPDAVVIQLWSGLDARFERIRFTWSYWIKKRTFERNWKKYFFGFFSFWL